MAIQSKYQVKAIYIYIYKQSFRPTNSSYIFILVMNFKNLTIRLHILITSIMFKNFQKNKKLIAIPLNK